MMKIILKHPSLFIWIFFLLTGVLVYWNTFSVFIPSEDYTFLFVFEKQGAHGILTRLQESSCYLVATPIIYFLYLLFHVNGYYWIAFSVLLHSTNAFLTYRLTESLRTCFPGSFNKWISLFSGLAFLLSPYQTEAVLWTPTDLYFLFSPFFTLLSLEFLVKYLEPAGGSENSSGKKWLILNHVAFICALFSYETAFTTPGIQFAFFLLFRGVGKTPLNGNKYIKWIIIPQGIFIFIYFLISKILFGAWIWHGGYDIELHFSAVYILVNTLKYLTKFFLFYRYIKPDGIDEFLRFNYHDPLFSICLLILFILTLIFFFRLLIKTDKPTGYALLMLGACFMVSLIPVITLDAAFTSIIYSDRYGYFPSCFFYILFSLFIVRVFKKTWKIILPVWIFINSFFLFQTFLEWKKADNFCEQILKSYELYLNEEDVYVLNLPVYYNGLAVFRSGFTEGIYYRYGVEIKEENIRIVSGSYSDSTSIPVVVQLRESNQLTVEAESGYVPYFSTKGGWAQSYANEEYRVDFDSIKCSYTVSFKEKIPENAVFLYVSGTIWKRWIPENEKSGI